MSDIAIIKESAAFASIEAEKLNPAIFMEQIYRALDGIRALDRKFTHGVEASKGVLEAGQKAPNAPSTDAAHRPAAKNNRTAQTESLHK